jgi:hypothetical protein
MDSRASWPAEMKKMVVKLATEVESNLIAYNGATNVLFFCKPATEKRDDIPGDPLPQITSTVCIQDPLQCLEECQLTIVLARSRYLYVAGINVVRLFLNQYCHIRINIINFFKPFPNPYSQQLHNHHHE